MRGGTINRPNRRITYLPALVLMIVSYSTGCAHYPVNQPLKQGDPQGGYSRKYTGIRSARTTGDVFVTTTAERILEIKKEAAITEIEK